MNIPQFRLLSVLCCALISVSASFAQISVATSFDKYGFEEGQTISKIAYDKNITITFKGTVTYNANGSIAVNKGTEICFEFSPNVNAVSSVEFYTSSYKEKDKLFPTVDPYKDGYLSKSNISYAYYMSDVSYITLYLVGWFSDGFSPKSKLRLTTGEQFNLYNLTVNYKKIQTSITDVEVDYPVATPQYYNLQGQPVANPQHNAIYIRVDSKGATKIRY